MDSVILNNKIRSAIRKSGLIYVSQVNHYAVGYSLPPAWHEWDRKGVRVEIKENSTKPKERIFIHASMVENFLNKFTSEELGIGVDFNEFYPEIYVFVKNETTTKDLRRISTDLAYVFAHLQEWKEQKVAEIEENAITEKVASIDRLIEKYQEEIKGLQEQREKILIGEE